MIAINKAHYPVTVLGHGNRIGIWTQGCSIACEGCISKDTWESSPDSLMQISQLLEWCKKFELKSLNGITISGGEPFEQPEALYKFLQELHLWRETLQHPFDILCYSGFSYKYLEKNHTKIVELCDVLITEPYNKNLDTLYLRGSSNQEIIILSDLANSRYSEEALEKYKYKKSFQTELFDNKVWFIGIPDRGDMYRLEQLCMEKGLTLELNSWTS